VLQIRLYGEHLIFKHQNVQQYKINAFIYEIKRGLLFFFHDCIYAFKTFKQRMFNYEFNHLMVYELNPSDNYIKKYIYNNLLTNVTHAKHYQELFNKQKNFLLSLCLKLHDKYFNRSKHFQKMRKKCLSCFKS